MRYFLPDSQDAVDPSYNFATERRSATRLRQRDDQYAHEVFSTTACDGYLVSKGIVDGIGGSGARYSIAQRQRLLREGAAEFFRTAASRWGEIPIMGDCGAFTYVREEKPPYTVDDVIGFYVACGFQLGVSVDHVILDFNSAWGAGPKDGAPKAVRARQDLTLELAREFLARHRSTKLAFTPLGVAQGWSPASYRRALKELQRIGYDYVALGGMVPLKTPEVIASLRAMNEVRAPGTRLHLLGVTRVESLATFAGMGVASFDSTSPLRQAFKDATDNYYTQDREFTAIRVPQIEGNPKLQKEISSGRVPQERARRLEQACLEAMRRFDSGELSVDATIEPLAEYEKLISPSSSYVDAYRETLEARPWKACPCDVCRSLGHHVILFRGAERNRRRGFHNTWVFYRRLRREISVSTVAGSRRSEGPTP